MKVSKPAMSPDAFGVTATPSAEPALVSAAAGLRSNEPTTDVAGVTEEVAERTRPAPSTATPMEPPRVAVSPSKSWARFTIVTSTPVSSWSRVTFMAATSADERPKAARFSSTNARAASTAEPSCSPDRVWPAAGYIVRGVPKRPSQVTRVPAPAFATRSLTAASRSLVGRIKGLPARLSWAVSWPALAETWCSRAALAEGIVVPTAIVEAAVARIVAAAAVRLRRKVEPFRCPVPPGCAAGPRRVQRKPALDVTRPG